MFYGKLACKFMNEKQNSRRKFKEQIKKQIFIDESLVLNKFVWTPI